MLDLIGVRPIPAGVVRQVDTLKVSCDETARRSNRKKRAVSLGISQSFILFLNGVSPVPDLANAKFFVAYLARTGTG